MRKFSTHFLTIVTAVALLLAGCAPQARPAEQPAAAQNLFSPLPQPAYPRYLAQSSTLELSDNYTETHLAGELFQLTFIEASGGKIGESEMQQFNTADEFLVSSVFSFGSADGAEYSIGYYNGDAAIRMKVEKTSLITLFTDARQNIIDNSNLYLIFCPTPDGTYQFCRAEYQEVWLGNTTDAVAMGRYVIWNSEQAKQVLSSNYHFWGFWQDGATFQEQSAMVTEALSQARSGLVNIPASFISNDEDSIRELIGKQTGMKLYRNGQPWGTVTMSYDNWLSGIGGTKGLSLIEFTFGVHTCNLIVLKSGLSPVDSWLYIMVCDNSETVAAIMSTQPENWPGMYKMLANDTMPGVISAVHVAGQPLPLSASGDVHVSDFEGNSSSGSVTITFGQAGGRTYSMLSEYSFERVYLTSQILALMGKSGINSMNLSFPTIGSGYNYYLLGTSVALAPEGSSVKSLSRVDLVGSLDIDFLESQLPQPLE